MANILDPNYGLDPLQQSMDQFAALRGAQQQQSMQPGPTGNGIMSALQGKDPTAMLLLGSALLNNSGNSRAGLGQRLGASFQQALPQILNQQASMTQQQSIKERTALAKQEIDQRKAQIDMQQSQITGVQQQAQAFLKAAIPGDADQNGILDANEKRALPYIKIAALTGKPEYLAKAEEMLNPDTKAAGPMSGIGKLQADLKAGLIDQPGYELGVQQILKPSVTINQGERQLGEQARYMRGPDGKPPPPTLSWAEATQQGYNYAPNQQLNPTDQQRTAAGFLNRMGAAEKIINSISMAGFDPASITENARGASNLTASPTFRQYRQAADDWIRAKLRKESGAVIGDEEMKKEYQTYFPQIGDDPGTQAQKAKARQEAMIQMDTSSASVQAKEGEAPAAGAVRWEDL